MELSIAKGKLSVKWSKILLMVLLFLSVVIAIASFTAICSYYPIIALQRNISHATIGLIFAAFQLGIFVFGPFLITLANYAGIRFAFVCSLLICYISTLLFSFMEFFDSNTSFVVASFVLRSLQGAGFFGVQTLSMTVVTDFYPDDLSLAVSVIEIANGIGYSSGPAIGGAFYQLFGFKAPTIFISSITFVLLLVVTLTTSEKKKYIKGTKTEENLLRSFLKIIQIPSMYIGFFTLVIFKISCSFHDFSISPYLKHALNFQQYEIGLTFTIASIFYSSAGPFVGFIVDRYNAPAVVMALGSLLFGASYFLLGPVIELNLMSPAIWAVVVSFIFTGLAGSCMFVPSMAYFLQTLNGKGIKVDKKIKSLLSSLLTYGGGIGGLLGSTIGGMMLEKMSFTKTCCYFTGINMLLFIIITFSVLKKRIFGQEIIQDTEELLSLNEN